jgi:hypothetical protein
VRNAPIVRRRGPKKNRMRIPQKAHAMRLAGETPQLYISTRPIATNPTPSMRLMIRARLALEDRVFAFTWFSPLNIRIYYEDAVWI